MGGGGQGSRGKAAGEPNGRMTPPHRLPLPAAVEWTKDIPVLGRGLGGLQNLYVPDGDQKGARPATELIKERCAGGSAAQPTAAQPSPAQPGPPPPLPQLARHSCSGSIPPHPAHLPALLHVVHVLAQGQEEAAGAEEDSAPELQPGRQQRATPPGQRFVQVAAVRARGGDAGGRGPVGCACQLTVAAVGWAAGAGAPGAVASAGGGTGGAAEGGQGCYPAGAPLTSRW